VIAVTNTPGSPLATQAAAAVLTEAGKEFSVSCKTYVAALMALKWLGDVLCEANLQGSRQRLKQAGPAAGAYLAHWKDHIQQLAEMLGNTRNLFLAGRGASLASTGTGALIIKESAHFQAEGMSSAAFRHGPLEMLGSDTFVFIFSGDAKTRKLNRRLLVDIRQKLGRAELIGKEASLPCCRIESDSTLRQVLEILPVQMITLALALRMGREPGRFAVASKITTTE